MAELKPCPFCGSNAAYIAKNYLGQHYARCPDCGAVVWGKDTDETITEKEAAKTWNRRTDGV